MIACICAVAYTVLAHQVLVCVCVNIDSHRTLSAGGGTFFLEFVFVRTGDRDRCAGTFYTSVCVCVCLFVSTTISIQVP